MSVKLAKSFFALLICITLVFSCVSVVFAKMDEDVKLTLEAFGLMEGYPDGSFGEDKRLTRAEMTAIAARVMGVGNGILSKEPPFADVLDDHWAKNVISALYDMGVVNGTENEQFAPDEYLDFNAAVKILVSALGYGSYAMEEGGYPDGYIKYASKLGYCW